MFGKIVLKSRSMHIYIYVFSYWYRNVSHEILILIENATLFKNLNLLLKYTIRDPSQKSWKLRVLDRKLATNDHHSGVTPKEIGITFEYAHVYIRLDGT